MIKRLLLASASLPLFALAAPAHAEGEINTDTTCSNSSAWMKDPGWTVEDGECVATNATRMKMLHQMTDQIKAGHWYEMTFTVTDYTSGYLRPFVGVNMPASAPLGSWVAVEDEEDVPDNFVTSTGVDTTSYTPRASHSGLDGTGPGDSADSIGAFRFGCNHAGFGLTDPIVYPNMQAPHLHEFYGNSGIHAARDQDSWTSEDFRTRGGSTCDNEGSKGRIALNRSGYWIPGMLDGEGNAIKARGITIYYKGEPNPDLNYTGEISPPGAAAALCGTSSPTATCANIPRHLRMTFGWKSSTGTLGPTDGSAFAGFHLSCFGASPGPDAGAEISDRWATLAEAMASDQCPIGSQLHVEMIFPNCWDAQHIDSPDHRSHVAYMQSGQCPATHPVAITGISIQVFYTVDQAFRDGKWRLSSDEMAGTCTGTAVTLGSSSTTVGCTYHGDYWEGWSPTIREKWYNQCILAHNTCSNDFGDGTGMKHDDAGYVGDTNGSSGGNYQRPDEKEPLTNYGMGRDYTANGTYTVRIRAPRDGVWGFMGLDNFNGKVDNITIHEVSGAKPIAALDLNGFRGFAGGSFGGGGAGASYAKP